MMIPKIKKNVTFAFNLIRLLEVYFPVDRRAVEEEMLPYEFGDKEGTL